MADVAYRNWSLIYRDADPEHQDSTVSQPPMLTTIAVDAGGSLVFELASAPSLLGIEVRATGASCESRGEEFLHVYRGTAGAYKRRDCSWTRGQDGVDALFQTTVDGAGDLLKLHVPDGATCIISAISIEADS